MMQDYIRTGTYQRAILSNGADFLGKVKQSFSHSTLYRPDWPKSGFGLWGQGWEFPILFLVPENI